MSKRNSRQAKAQRRRAREVRHVGGCSICGDKEVVWVDEKEAADPSYRAICKFHLAYAVSTIFVGSNRGLSRPAPPKPKPTKAEDKQEKLPPSILDKYEPKDIKMQVVSSIDQSLRRHRQAVGEAIGGLATLFGHPGPSGAVSEASEGNEKVGAA